MVVIAVLLVVGAVSHGVIRHIVQTAPLWIVIALAIRRSQAADWAAIPCFAVWLFIMAAIWLFLLGWARLVTGTFSPVEIAMTMVVGSASVLGSAARWQWISPTLEYRVVGVVSRPGSACA